MYPRDRRLRPAVAVGIAGEDLFVPAQEHVVHAPGVDREAFQLRKCRPCRVDARLYMAQQRAEIPGQVPAPLSDAVGEAVDLLRVQRAVFRPAYDVAT